MQTILITGSTGFLGSHLVEALLAKGFHVVALKRSTSNTWRIDHLSTQIKFYDIDHQTIDTVFEQQPIDAVIHTACLYGRNQESLPEIVESNLMFGLRVLAACLQFKVGFFVNTDTFFNTAAPVQKHLLAYTLSKKQFVEWLLHHSQKIKVVNLRLEHMYGPKDDKSKFLPWVLGQFRAEAAEIKLTAGEQQRDFIYVRDVVSAYMTVLEKAGGLTDFSEFDVGTNHVCTLKEFLRKLKRTYEALHGPSGTTLNFGAVPYGEGEIMRVKVDNSGLLELGWKPLFSPQRGLKETMMAEDSQAG